MMNGNTECSLCHKTFKSATTLRNHKCSCCTVCHTIYSSYQKFAQHYCKTAQNQCSTPPTQKVGVAPGTPTQHIECSLCHKTYKTATTLKNHKCSWCTVCHKIYSSYHKFTQHYCKAAQKQCSTPPTKKTVAPGTPSPSTQKQHSTPSAQKQCSTPSAQKQCSTPSAQKQCSTPSAQQQCSIPSTQQQCSMPSTQQHCK